jgi:hypothetical protein
MFDRKFREQVDVVKNEKPVNWNMSELGHSYYFYTERNGKPDQEVFYELDEILRVEGTAFEKELPLTALDIINQLKEELVNFDSILYEDFVLTVKKGKTPGITVKYRGETREFVSNKTLETINWIGFLEYLSEIDSGNVEEKNGPFKLSEFRKSQTENKSARIVNS